MSKQWSSKKKQAVWDKTGGMCWYCGKQLVIGNAKDAESRKLIRQWFCIDHVIPKTKGGSNKLENLLPACWICNATKCYRSLEDYRMLLAVRELDIPYFRPEQVSWLRNRGFDFIELEAIKFWGELQGIRV